MLLIYIKLDLHFELLPCTCLCLQGHRNGPGDALLNQKRGMDRSFVLGTGFPRIDKKQEEQKNSSDECATQNILPFMCANPSFGSCPEQERCVAIVARICSVFSQKPADQYVVRFISVLFEDSGVLELSV